MRCHRYFGFIVFALFASLFFTSLFTADSYAVEDMTVTYSSYPGEWIDVFPNCTGTCLDDYHYLKIEVSSSGVAYNDVSRLYLRYDGSQILSFPYSRVPEVILSLPFDGHSNNLLQFSNNTRGFPVTYTLMDSLSSGITPSGILNIAENGSYDVTQYAQVDVNIEQEVVYQDYHDDLVNINHSIIICAATILVLYFFYCIYRMIIKGAGVK